MVHGTEAYWALPIEQAFSFVSSSIKRLLINTVLSLFALDE